MSTLLLHSSSSPEAYQVADAVKIGEIEQIVISFSMLWLHKCYDEHQVTNLSAVAVTELRIT